jgi:hypothetical protein
MKTMLIGAIFATSVNCYADTPAWTIEPVTPTHITISKNEYKIVQYIVTNKTKSVKTLSMKQIQGVKQDTSPGNCGNPFALNHYQTCVLTLTINGSELYSNITDGPIICAGNDTMCYRPSAGNTLNVVLK